MRTREKKKFCGFVVSYLIVSFPLGLLHCQYSCRIYFAEVFNCINYAHFVSFYIIWTFISERQAFFDSDSPVELRRRRWKYRTCCVYICIKFLQSALGILINGGALVL